VHIVHVACREAMDAIARAKAGGVWITGETCPHHLTFAAEEIPDGATEFKCAPPIRGRSQRDALRAGLRAGALDLIATDHSPAPAALKCAGDFGRAWGGIASLELSLAAVWTVMSDASTGGDEDGTLIAIARWMSGNPAGLAGMDGRKGAIEAGRDADFVLFDPEAVRTVDPESLQQRHKLTPYAGRTLRGVVRATYVRGVCVWDGRGLARPAKGALL
jgi:allantoinase